MDQAVKKALGKRQEIIAEIARLRKELDETDGFLALYERFSGTRIERGEATGVAAQAVTNGEAAAPMFLRRKKAAPAEIADTAEKIIVQKGQPMTRGEIAAALDQRGVILPGKDQSERARYIGTIMWRRSDRFLNLEGRGYWPKSAIEPRPKDSLL